MGSIKEFFGSDKHSPIAPPGGWGIAIVSGEWNAGDTFVDEAHDVIEITKIVGPCTGFKPFECPAARIMVGLPKDLHSDMQVEHDHLLEEGATEMHFALTKRIPGDAFHEARRVIGLTLTEQNGEWWCVAPSSFDPAALEWDDVVWCGHYMHITAAEQVGRPIGGASVTALAKNRPWAIKHADAPDCFGAYSAYKLKVKIPKD